MAKTYAFELTMPHVNTWNGSWSGKDKRYIKFKRLTNKQIQESGIKEDSFYYNFGDGWGANVNVFTVDSTERQKLQRLSDGFMGYDWMIDSIIENGKIISE